MSEKLKSPLTYIEDQIQNLLILQGFMAKEPVSPLVGNDAHVVEVIFSRTVR